MAIQGRSAASLLPTALPSTALQFTDVSPIGPEATSKGHSGVEGTQGQLWAVRGHQGGSMGVEGAVDVAGDVAAGARRAAPGGQCGRCDPRPHPRQTT